MQERCIFNQETVSETAGCAYLASSEAFGMIRGGHLDLTVLGGMEVSEKGDLANWMIPGFKARGMGGAMDLVASGSKVVVVMKHSSKGKSKVVKECTLPLTGRGKVSLLITDLGVFDFSRSNRMTLIELFKGVSLEKLRSLTDANFDVASDLKVLDF